ncbi:Chitin elicitor receptor kinase [Orobanche hederae]
MDIQAINQMGVEARKKFIAELKVVAHVHHLNLVSLKGYCVKGSLYLVYEHIENGNLSQHLCGSSGFDVADLGLAKLSQYGRPRLMTRLLGTTGYMPPEYVQFAQVSPKVDVYAFGVVLFELISAKVAVEETTEYVSKQGGLVASFETVLSQPEPRENLAKLVDHRLSNNDYSLDSVYKMAQLAKACTQKNPQLRPSMSSVVAELLTIVIN